MRLSAIWGRPWRQSRGGYSLRERLRRTGEFVALWLAHRLPRRVAYWSLIDSGVRYMESDEVVPEVPFMTILQRAGDD